MFIFIERHAVARCAVSTGAQQSGSSTTDDQLKFDNKMRPTKSTKSKKSQGAFMEESLTMEETKQLKDKITSLEQTTTTLKEELEEIKNQYNILRQLINDTDTKFLITSTQQGKEIQVLKTSISNSQQAENNHNNGSNTKSSIDITAPTFSGENKEEHPKKFLKEIHDYLEHKQITNSKDKLIVIENNLRGKAAKWFTMVKDATLDITIFNELFLKNFFSESHQWNIFIKCTEAGKKPIKKDFQEHFHYWMAELKYLDSPKMNEEQAINLITKHFPIAIQAYIQSTKDKKFLPIWEKLVELEINKHNEEDTTKQNENTQRQTTYRQNNTYKTPYPNNNQYYKNQSNPHRTYTPRTQGNENVQTPNIRQLTTSQQHEEISDIENEDEYNNMQKNWEQGTVETDQLQSQTPSI